MKNTDGQTTMICLFHSPDQADAAMKDLIRAGIPKESIGVMGSPGTAAANPAAMEKWKVPERDARLLTDGINSGGVVLAVSAGAMMADKVENIFNRHQAEQVDETGAGSTHSPLKTAVAANTAANGKIEVIEEEMTVGKREVQLGGVRVYQRTIEKPVSETISLREEHVTVERHPVNRPATAADAAAFKERSFEVTETGEEAVVSKRARVVEEVLVGKESSERTQTVKGTVRKTDVTVDRIEPGTKSNPPGEK